MFRYVVTLDATWDLDDIDEYVLSYSDIDFVESLEQRFEAMFDELARAPYTYPLYQFSPPLHTLHQYRSANVYHYKIFYYVDESRGLVVISRICNVASDFTRRGLR